MKSARLFKSRFLYRPRQLWQALQARPACQDLALIREELSPAQAALFGRMQLSEQAHSLQVYHKLRERGETDPDLLRAALLHDAGKCLYPMRLWERIVIVLARRFFPKQARTWGALDEGSGQAEYGRVGALASWRRPFIIAEQHPAWGARLAEQAGLSPRAAVLIRRHQEKLSNGDASSHSRPEMLVERAQPASSVWLEREIIQLLRILQSVDDES